MCIRVSWFVIYLAVTRAVTSNNVARGDAVGAAIQDLLPQLKSKNMDAVLYWNTVTLAACGNDYDPAIVPVPAQIGPTATGRAFAIVHGAMYDSLKVVNTLFLPSGNLTNLNQSVIARKSALSGAIMEAAYQTLCAMYPQQKLVFDAARKEFRSQLNGKKYNRKAVNQGVLIGRAVSTSILNKRKYDGSEFNETYVPVPMPGYHRPDPTQAIQDFVGFQWGNVKPFLLGYGSQYRPLNVIGDTPYDRAEYLRSKKYIDDFKEVKDFGAKNSTLRTADQTEIAIFWAYDAVPKLGVPPRLYNQIVRVVAVQQRNSLTTNARLFALVNYAMADAGIAAWDCKYHYQMWRPIVGIREGTEYTKADPNWLPLGSPGDNSVPSSTPPFPSYVSGHSTFGSTVFETLRLFYGNDSIPFEFQSDEFNGQTIDTETGTVRPRAKRHYRSFSQAEIENYLSRIYLGVHWRTDQEQGMVLGRKIAQYAFQRFS